MALGMPAGELVVLFVALLAAGFATGVLAGLLGIGGGGILVPLLYELFGALGTDDAIRMHLAVGTSLAVIAPTSLRSFAAHRARGAVDLELVKSMALPVVLGVGLGAVLARYADFDGAPGGLGRRGEPDRAQAAARARQLAPRRCRAGQPVPRALRRLRRPGLDADEHRRRRVHHRADDLLRPADAARRGDLVGLRAADLDPGRARLRLGRLERAGPAARARSATSACSARS